MTQREERHTDKDSFLVTTGLVSEGFWVFCFSLVYIFGSGPCKDIFLHVYNLFLPVKALEIGWC